LSASGKAIKVSAMQMVEAHTRRAPAVVLLSGGLDSSTVLAIAREQGFEPCAISFSYGQRHIHELSAADAVVRTQQAARHVVATIDLRAFGGSALTADIDVPKGRSAHDMAEGIPITYVPARNTVFLSYALAWAETLGSTDIFIRPPYEFRRINALLTNFHLPGSTLLILVSALAGRERMLAAYAEAVREQYRFFSYGDCMLIV
jgi:hypothetical protein